MGDEQEWISFGDPDPVIKVTGGQRNLNMPCLHSLLKRRMENTKTGTDISFGVAKEQIRF